MDPGALRKLLRDVADGHVEIDQAMTSLRDLPFKDIGIANVDHHRALRTGLPEVIFGLGKTTDHIARIVTEIRAREQPVLISRLAQNQATELAQSFHDFNYDATARAALVGQRIINVATRGTLCVVTAGTSDIPVAEEACFTAEAFGNSVTRVYDVGVAGIHRLLAKREAIESASVVIVVAGMEGALASVVGGLVSKPVIAVPTSIGYGASLGGFAALLSMLNSCASGVTVVNIDNGFGAAYAATLINRADTP